MTKGAHYHENVMGETFHKINVAYEKKGHGNKSHFSHYFLCKLLKELMRVKVNTMSML